MKIKTFFLTALTAFSLNGISQTLYVPSGTGGIGSSSTANVGIGISNPSYKLHLNSTTNGWSSVIQNQGCIVYSAYGNGTSDGYGMHIRVNNSRSDRYALQVYNGSKYLLNVKNDGNVGIGCDPGSTTFKVYKSSLPFFELADATTRLNIYINNDQVVYRALGAKHQLVFHMSDNNNDGNSFIQFSDDANGAWYKIFNNRTVRIDGTIFASEINVQTNVWADYVFNSDYKLRSLNEVESFINENKRLPDVPSEQEVKENGINLAEMNALLLKKVEETILYVIELKKQNEQLVNRIEQLEKQ